MAYSALSDESALSFRVSTILRCTLRWWPAHPRLTFVFGKFTIKIDD